MDWDREFSDFVRAHADDLYRSAGLLAQDPARAADLVQETLVRLYPKWPKVRGADSPLAYVRKAVVNQFLSESRRAHKRDIVTATPPERVGDDDPHVAVEARVWLERPLAALPPKQRAAITLVYYCDLSAADGAAAMGCRVTTFRSHLKRGLAALRAHLTDELESRSTR